MAQFGEMKNYFNEDAGTTIISPSNCDLDLAVEYLSGDRSLGVTLAFDDANQADLESLILRCPWLECVVVLGAPSDIAVLEELTQLKYLVAYDCGISDFSNLKNLWYYRGHYVKKIKGLEDIDTLKSIYFHGAKPKDKNIHSLGLPANVERLTLVRGNIQDLTGVDIFKNLGELSLSYLPKLEDIQAVAKCDQLKKLEFDNCKKAFDADVLSQLKLNDLSFNNCGVIPELSFLENASTLESFKFVNTKVESGDLSPLLKLPNLCYAGFMDSKAYNLKFDEVNARLSS